MGAGDIRSSESLAAELASPAATKSEAKAFSLQHEGRVEITGLPRRTSSVGHRLGRYEIKSVIQRGGMGELYLAEVADGPERGERVVLKCLLSELIDDERYVAMFRQEARVMAALDHPNIVRFKELAELEGKLVLALEFVAGRNLQQVQRKARELGRTLPVPVSLYVMEQVLRGLHHAHEAKLADGRVMDLVHRDVTPGNLLVSYDGAVKLADFGIAKSRISLVATTVGMVKGTTRYLSPEQIKGELVTRRSDLYSAAVVLVELLSGVDLFDRGSVAPTLFAIIRGERPPVAELIPVQHRGLITALERALSTKSLERQTTALELAETLHSVGAELGRVDATLLGVFLRQLFPGGDDLASTPEPLRTNTLDPLGLTYLFELHEPLAAAKAQGLFAEEGVDAAGAEPLDATQFEAPKPPMRRRPDSPPPPVFVEEEVGAEDIQEVEDATPATAVTAKRTVEAGSSSILESIESAARALAQVEPPPAEPSLEVQRLDGASDPEVERDAFAEGSHSVAAAAQPATRRGALLFVAGTVFGALGTGLAAWVLRPEPPQRTVLAPVVLERSAPPPPVAPPPEPVATATVTEAPLEEGRGFIDVSWPRGARVRVDGILISRRVPVVAFPVEPGRRTVTVFKGNYRRTVSFDIAVGLRLDVTKEPVERVVQPLHKP